MVLVLNIKELWVYIVFAKFNIPYLHMPHLKPYEYQGLQALEKNKNSDSMLEIRCNKRINIESTIDITKLKDIKYIIVSIENMLRLKEICKKTNKNVIMEMEYPYRITR